jgi:hypothetical protein
MDECFFNIRTVLPESSAYFQVNKKGSPQAAFWLRSLDTASDQRPFERSLAMAASWATAAASSACALA